MARQKAIMRPFWRSCAIGLAVSALMVTLYATQTLWQAEDWFLDMRFKYANRSLKPSDDIRIIAIDDQTLTQLDREYGRYPWPRRVFADLVDVLAEAGAQRIALDLHFPEALRVLQLPASSQQLLEPPVQDDQRFAEAVGRAGNVYLPIVLDVMPGRYDMAEVGRIGRELARENTVLGDQQYSRRVGLPVALLGQDASLRGRMANLLRQRFWLSDQVLAETLKVNVQAVQKWIGPVKRQVALELVRARLASDPQATVDSIYRVLGRPQTGTVRASPDEEIAWALNLMRIERIIWPNLLSLPQQDLSALPQILNPFQVQLPIAPLAEATRGFGHVEFQPDPDGPVRRLSMLVRWGDRLVPQMALRVATDMLHLQWDRAQVTAEKITVPGRTDNGQEAIYTLYLDATGRTLVNWTRPGNDWKSCFAPMSASAVLEVALLRQTMRRNLADMELALLQLVQKTQPNELDRYKTLKQREREIQRQLPPRVPASQRKPGRSLQDDLEQIRTGARKIEMASIDLLKLNREDMPATIDQATDPDVKEYLSLYEEIVEGKLATRIATANADLAVTANQWLSQLRKELAGKTVFVGCTAVALADIVSTSVWPSSPGVMTHAQVLNALLANRSIRPIGNDVNLAIVLACCLVMTFVAAWLGPQASLATMAATCTAFFLFAMYVLFEWMGIAIALATPLAGMFLTWAMITAYRQLVEERAKRHMTRTLQQYTSPALARRMAEDPTAVTRAENREVTCFFSDLKGFTGISEQLGAEATQLVLNVYLDRMTEALDKREALVSKFLGDGIFAFFNPAINPQEDHAERACLAALDAMAALELLKRQPQGANCQPLHMRIGLASGMAVVGNCGSERKFDYTCIGDTVNLASRLEGANKAFGTGILINARCKDLLAGDLVCRYMGKVVVIGRAAYEDTYELIGRREQVSAARLEQIERFEQAVRCFVGGNLERAKEGFAQCLREDASDAAARFYASLCDKHPQSPLPDSWNGAVEMTGK